MADPITLGLLAAGGVGFAASKLFSGGGKRDSASSTLQQTSVPQVADDSAAKRRRRIGRSALIFTDQEDILGEMPSLGRGELIAF